jgi:5-methylcytosine-specific restriction endonuclease McrA
MPKSSRRTVKLKGKSRKVNHNVSEYQSNDWRVYSKGYRRINPECSTCGKRTQCVDHIIPIRIGGSFWDVRNHQSLCNKCHARKSSNEGRDIYLSSTTNIDGELIPRQGGQSRK